MKYTTLRALILAGFAASVTGCYNYDPNYDVGRMHDIYRQDYKYKPPQQPGEGTTAPAPPPPSDAAAPSPGTAPGR